jgi:hypothetical protein
MRRARLLWLMPPRTLSWAAGRDGVAARTVTAHQLTESQQVATSPKTPAAISQPSDRQWDCNCISGCRSVVGEAGYRGCFR